MPEQITKDDWMVGEILSAAKKLFAENGLKKTTMEDIAHAMGKGKSTLYYYFPGKLEIFEAVVDEELKNLLRITRQAINMATTAKDKLKAYIRTRVCSMETFRNLSVVIYEDMFNHLSEIFKIKLRHEEIQLDLIQEIVKGGVQSGEFKGLAERNIEMFSSALAAAFRGVEIPRPALKLLTNYENGSDLLVDVMVDGIKG